MTSDDAGGRLVAYRCDGCGFVPDPDTGDHGQPTCPECGRTVEQVATDGGEPLELENEGEIIENPRFVCERCGFANVELIDAPLPAAKCTNCGVGYFERKVATDGGVPVMSGDVVDAEQRDDGTIVASVEFDTEQVPDALPVMDWLTAGDVQLSIAPEDGGHVLTDGGHPPGPSASEVHPDAVFMGTATHKCDGCGETFEEIEELAEHDCRPLAGVELGARDVLARTGGDV